MADALDKLPLEKLRRLAEERGLTVPPRTRRAQLVRRIREAEAEAAAAVPHGDAPPDSSGDLQLQVTRAKFDLRPDGQPPVWHDIPWGYGETRVTVMPRDPEFLYVYWEATDEAVADARGRLGPGGPGAFCVLRVYDTTYRLFDGTNANRYFDVPVDRAWNNYFLRVDRLGAVFHVEIGMKSTEGYFAAMARSGAAEMPAASVSGDGRVEWMTVQTGAQVPGPSTYRHRYVPRPAPSWVGQPPGAHAGGEVSWSWTSPPSGEGWEVDFERVLASLVGGEAAGQGAWYEQVMGGRVVRWIRWVGGRRRFTWRSGPTSALPAGLFGPVEIWFEGRRHVLRAGDDAAQAEFGPWHIVISGPGLSGERRLYDTWIVRVAWATELGRERVETPLIYRHILGAYRRSGTVGASELMLRESIGASEELMAGASERLWLAASEMMMGGASEFLRVGASERFGMGASEFAWGGASGASWGGASDFRWGSASGFSFVGASEGPPVGASERVLPVSSEAVVGVSRGPGWTGFAVATPREKDPGPGAPRGADVSVSELLPPVEPLPPVRPKAGVAPPPGGPAPVQMDLFESAGMPAATPLPKAGRRSAAKKPAAKAKPLSKSPAKKPPRRPAKSAKPKSSAKPTGSAKRKPAAKKPVTKKKPGAKKPAPARGKPAGEARRKKR